MLPSISKRPGLQVPGQYLLCGVVALMLVCGLYAYQESLVVLPPNHVVRLQPTHAAEHSRLRQLISTTSHGRVRLGLVTLTQGTRSLDEWLRHHYRHCGVNRIYLQIESSAELSILRRTPWKELVLVLPAGRKPAVERQYRQQLDRQAALMAQAIRRAHVDRISHLITIDDDELLFCPAGCAALHAALAAAPEPALVVDNLEALAPAADSTAVGAQGAHGGEPRGHTSFFGQSEVFRHNSSSYAGYRHGKAVGALERRLVPNGCCRFKQGSQPVPDVRLASYVAVLLHFESPTFGWWRAKFLPMAVAHPQSDPPGIAPLSPYYTSSLHAARMVLRARNGSAASVAAMNSARRIWAAWRRAPEGLPSAPRKPGATRELLDLGLTLLQPLSALPFPDRSTTGGEPAGEDQGASKATPSRVR